MIKEGIAAISMTSRAIEKEFAKYLDIIQVLLNCLDVSFY